MGHGPKPSRILVKAFLASPEVQASQESHLAIWKQGIHQMSDDVDQAALFHTGGEFFVKGLATLADKSAPGLGVLLNMAFDDAMKAVEDANDA